MAAVRKSAARPAAHTTTTADKSSPLAKRAQRQGYKLPDVPDDVVLEEQQPKMVTADKGSPLAKRAKRQGYDLPESPETVITADENVTVPLGKG